MGFQGFWFQGFNVRGREFLGGGRGGGASTSSPLFLSALDPLPPRTDIFWAGGGKGERFFKSQTYPMPRGQTGQKEKGKEKQMEKKKRTERGGHKIKRVKKNWKLKKKNRK